MNRNLDGCYFRIKRDDWMNVCFSDLTPEEREEVTKGRGEEWLRSLCYHLADRLKAVGDQLDIYVE